MNTLRLQKAGQKFLVAAGIITVLGMGTARGTSSLETFVLCVGGESSYSTFGAPAPVFENFGPIGVGVPGNPAGLAASNVGGDFKDATQTNAPLFASYGFRSGTWVSTWSSANSYSGVAAAAAGYGQIGATTSGAYAGWGGTFTVAGSEAFAIFTEQLLITSPSVAAGTPGTIRFSITLGGSITGAGDQYQTGIQTFYKLGTGPSYALVNASINAGSGNFYPFSGPGRAGFSITATNINGQGSFDTFDLPFTFGQPIDLRIGLLAYNTPGKNAVADVRFGSGLKITGIVVNGVSDFSITSGSGATYGPNGLQSAAFPAPKIVSEDFNAGAFRMLVTGLDPTRFYVLKRSDNLLDGFPTTVDGPRQPAAGGDPGSDFFTDPAPATAHGFYRIESAP